VRTMYRVWLGKRNLREALRAGELEIEGTPAVARRLPTALQLSPIASVVAAEGRA
jgi:hypothetical protein